MPEYRRCFAKWIVDASQGMGPCILASNQDDTDGMVNNLCLLMERVRIPKQVAAGISQDLVAVEAVDVEELGQEDWEGFPSWSLLKPAERRRIL